MPEDSSSIAVVDVNAGGSVAQPQPVEQDDAEEEVLPSSLDAQFAAFEARYAEMMGCARAALGCPKDANVTADLDGLSSTDSDPQKIAQIEVVRDERGQTLRCVQRRRTATCRVPALRS